MSLRSWGAGTFQFTPLREGRLLVSPRYMKLDYISIHAPPRGATFVLFFAENVAVYFNSRPSARGDGRLFCNFTHQTDFNSRPSARGDAFAERQPMQDGLFQFTPLREGRQIRERGASLHVLISIHAPPRGATNQWWLKTTT